MLAEYTVVNPASASLVAPETDAVPGRFWHRKILAGRLADPARPGEVNVSFTLAEALHLGVGGILRATVLTAARHLARFSFRIVGIDAAPSEFPPQTGTGTDMVWATPAFYREHHAGLGSSAGALRLRRGNTDLPAFQGAVSRLGHGKVVQDFPLAEQAVNTEHSIHLQAVALWLVSGLLAVIGLLVLGQLLARLSFLDAAEYGTLLALGMSRRGAARPRLEPRGRDRGGRRRRRCAARRPRIARAARRPGRSGRAASRPSRRRQRARPGRGGHGARDRGRGRLASLAGGGGGRARARAAAAGTRPGTAAAGRPRARAGGPRLAAAATAGISSVTALIGLRLALQPGAGRTALPVRSTIASAMVGVAALTAARGLLRQPGQPARHPAAVRRHLGRLREQRLADQVSLAARGVADDPAVAAWATGYSSAPLTIGGVSADAIALLPGHHASLQPGARPGPPAARPG